MRGHSSGRRVHPHPNITLQRLPLSGAGVRFGTSSIRKTRIGSTNRDRRTRLSSVAIAGPSIKPESVLPSRGRVGMFSFIAAEAAIFTIFVVAYIFYIGKSVSGPTPKDVLELPIFGTVCLLSSSLTIHLAVRALRNAKVGAFGLWWFVTLALGAIFLVSTGREWHHLIYDKGLT